MSKIVPNSFPTPNVYIDEMMEMLSEGELKCLLFAVRHVFGWQDRPNDRPRAISISMFQNGFSTEAGKQFRGTGLSRASIVKALAELDKYRILVKRRNKNGDAVVSAHGQQYSIGADPDIEGLQKRFSDRAATSVKQTAAARKKKTEKAVSLTDQSVEQTEVVSLTDQSGLSNRLNQINSTKPEKEKQSTPRKRDVVFDAIAEHIFKLDAEQVKVTKSGARIGKIRRWLTANHPLTTPEDIEKFARHCGRFTPHDDTKFAEAWLRWRAARISTVASAPIDYSAYDATLDAAAFEVG